MVCAKHLKKGCFELGGSDPFIVLKGANLERAVDAAWTSRMANTGQVCISAKRFIITAPVYDEFRDRLMQKIKSTAVIGDPSNPQTNVGPLASANQKDILIQQMHRFTGEGKARIVHGDINYQIEDPELQDGNFVDVMMLEGMDQGSQSYREELFGPVFNLFKVDSSKEALDLANNSDYGLGSSVWTDDLEKAEVAAKRIRAGSVFINDIVSASSEYPGGGIKGSGYGRECYTDGLLETANRKTIVRNHAN